MMKLIVGIAIAILAGWGSLARAAEPERSSSSTQESKTSTETSTSAAQGREMAGAPGRQLSAAPYVGVVKGVDKDKGTITIELPLAKNARITRDGTQVSLGEVKEGDDVRASFEPKAEGITRLDTESKQMMKEQMKTKEQKTTK